MAGIPPFGSPPTPNASTTVKGKVKLAGSLAGTADLPTLSTVGTPGTYGDATHVAQITTNAEGRVTAVTSVAISVTAPTQRTFAYWAAG